MLKKIAFIFLFFLITLLIPTSNLFAKTQKINTEDKIILELFYSPTCPHCHNEISFLGTMQTKYKKLQVNNHNVFDVGTKNKLTEYYKKYNVPKFRQGQVPLTFINNKYYLGFSDSIAYEIENQIKKLDKKQVDQNNYQKNTTNTTNTLNIPLLGNINLKEHSPLFLSIFLGTLDGFNACAMVALGFLLAVLIATRMRKRVLIVGGTFILVSGLVYFLFISAWLNLFIFLGQARWITIIISLITILFGLFVLKDYIFGIVCKICNINPNSKNPLNKWQKKLFTKMSSITGSKMPLPLMLLGVAIVAAGINTIELFCSLGFPLAFANYLTSLGLSTSNYYFYLIIYVIFYMIDDLIIFLIALATLRITKISDKYLRFIMFISGIVLIILGIYMLTKGF